MIKAIYFDLDNTLVNRDASIDKFAHHLIKTMSFELRNACPIQVSNIIKEQDCGGYLTENSAYSKILQALGCELSLKLSWIKNKRPEDLSLFWTNDFPKCTVEMSGAANLINYLHQQAYHLGVISNGAELSRRSTLEATSFKHLLSQMVSSENFGVSKPDPSIFEHTAKLAGYKTEECIYFGDHPVNDILGATGSGMRAVWLAGFHDEIILPKETVIVNNLNDVLKVLSL